MKKVLLISSLAMLFSTTSFAEENKLPFTEGYLGIELNSTKQKFSVPLAELGWNSNETSEAQSSRKAILGLMGGYGIDFGNDFVGLVEAKLRFNNAKTKSYDTYVTKSYFESEFAYLQGFRINNVALPYVKLGANALLFKLNDDQINRSRVQQQRDGIAVGLSYGAGVRFNLSQGLNLGIEYSKANLRDSNKMRFKNDNLGLNLTYHF